VMSVRVLVNQPHPHRPRIDIPGTLTATGGLFAVVYGFSNAETSSWGDTLTIVSFVVAGVLLLSFFLIELRTRDPLLPLHIIWDRARGGMYLSILLAVSGIFGVFLFLTFFMQQNLHFSPIGNGLAYLPMNVTIVATSTTAQTRILPRTGPRAVVIFGMVIGCIAMWFFTRLTPSSTYVADVLPGLILVGLAMGSIFSAGFGTATLGVKPTEAGVASAMVNTSQQVGGSIGTAALSTVFASATASYITSHLAAHVHTTGLRAAAFVHGYTAAFWWAAGIYVVGLLVALFVLPPRKRVVEVASVAARDAPRPAGEPALAAD